MDFLFYLSDLNSELKNKSIFLDQRIAQYALNEIIEKEINQTINLIFDEIKIKTPKLRSDQANIIYTTEIEIQKKDYGREITIPGIAIMIEVPIEGDVEYFLWKPSKYTSVFPQGKVKDHAVLLTYTFPKNSNADIKLLYKRSIENIQEYLSWVRSDINSFNESLKQKIEQKIRTKKALQDQIHKKVSELGLPRKEQPEQTSSTKHLPTPKQNTKFDAFISHAIEDKDIVKLIVKNLISSGFKIWYDEFELKIGDSLRKSIDLGITNSKYGIVILSKSFFEKKWTEYELNGLIAKEIEGKKVILPIWREITKEVVLSYSPTLADKFALTIPDIPEFNIQEICTQIIEVIRD